MPKEKPQLWNIQADFWCPWLHHSFKAPRSVGTLQGWQKLMDTYAVVCYSISSSIHNKKKKQTQNSFLKADFSCSLHKIRESQNGLGLKGPKRPSNPNPLPWAGTPLTSPGCSKPHQTWPRALPGMEQPQLWANRKQENADLFSRKHSRFGVCAHPILPLPRCSRSAKQQGRAPFPPPHTSCEQQLSNPFSRNHRNTAPS